MSSDSGKQYSELVQMAVKAVQDVPESLKERAFEIILADLLSVGCVQNGIATKQIEKNKGSFGDPETDKTPTLPEFLERIGKVNDVKKYVAVCYYIEKYDEKNEITHDEIRDLWYGKKPSNWSVIRARSFDGGYLRGDKQTSFQTSRKGEAWVENRLANPMSVD
jgi:hypothetical protein